jgi:uncharacterized protein YgiM (DUF1202 family)
MRRIAVVPVPVLASVLAMTVLAHCAAPAPPAPAPAPEPAPAPVTAPTEPAAVGTVRVTATTLNVRKEPATTGEVIVQVKKGDKLALLATRAAWSNVRLADGTTGWVSSKLVSSDAAASTSRRRGNCTPDSDYRFVQAPVPSFSDNSTVHGIVTVEANVNPQGVVMSTKVVSNTTGDEAAAVLAEHEIRKAKFAPPVRNCVPKAFIFTYTRTF